MAKNTAPAGASKAKAPAKKTSAKKAAPAKAAAAKKAPISAADRRTTPRGWLAEAVLKVCTNYQAGKVKIEGDKPLTPHRVANLIGPRAELGGGIPSTGAVAAVFDRWNEFGFALFSDKPKAFKKLTAKGEKEGLAGLILSRREGRKAVTAKARAAAK